MTAVDRVEIKKNTDQLNYEDFLGGITRTVTIVRVERGRKEAQYDIAIEGDDRYWRPPATVLKLLVLAYGDATTNWVGKKAALYGDPEVKAPGGKKVGGIRVSHLSHIDKPIVAPLSITRGQTGIFIVDPLPDAPTPPSEAGPSPEELAAQVVAALADATTEAEVREWGNRAYMRDLLDFQVDGETVRNYVTYRLAEVAEIDAQPTEDGASE